MGGIWHEKQGMIRVSTGSIQESIMVPNPAATDLPYFQSDFTIAEFAKRRARIAWEIGPDTAAVLRGGISTGAFDIFRQTNEFYYLSGVEVPHACLLIEGGTGNTVLYLPHGDAHASETEGRELNADEADLAVQVTGVHEAKPLDSLAQDLDRFNTIYTPFSPGEARMQCRDMLLSASKQRIADPWEDPQSAEERFREKIASARPGAEIRDLSPILDRFRLIKSPAEIELMRKAGHLTALAVLEAMRSTSPGILESQLGAVADYFYMVNGAKGGGYRPIIASGEMIWSAHYFRNNRTLRDGDLVLMDYAPDVGCYTSDIGRIWPVNGTYSDWQRELYGFIVEYHKVLLATIRPGRTAAEIHAEAADQMRPIIESTRWSKPTFEAAARKTLEFKGHLSHPVGMAVHDVGNYHDSPLLPGTVFALDPQMWVPEERLYIRVEDTVVVTEAGIENLTSLAPQELDQVDRTILQTGLLERYPPLAAM
jgi:Xaa-Pro aminopeptidase